MTLEEQTDALLDQAQLEIDNGPDAGNAVMAKAINDFLRLHEVELVNSGSQWRVDQLDAASGFLTGNSAGPAAPQTSPFWSGMKSYGGDTAKLDPQYLKQGAGAVGQAVGDSAGNFLTNAFKNPAMLAVLVVGGVMAAAWVYRSAR